MKNRNKDSTRFYSEKQEEHVAKALGGFRTSNSGAGKFSAGDVVIPSASLLVECKTCMSEKDSFSIKKEWWDKNKLEAFEKRLSNRALVFNWGPNTENVYIISEELMKYLITKLEEV